MFGRKKQDDGRRTMVIGLNSGSTPGAGLTLGDVRDFVYRSMTLGVPLQAPVSLTAGRGRRGLHGISVATTDIPKPPDPSSLWPPPAPGLPERPATARNGSHSGPGHFHDGGTAGPTVRHGDQ